MFIQGDIGSETWYTLCRSPITKLTQRDRQLLTLTATQKGPGHSVDSNLEAACCEVTTAPLCCHSQHQFSVILLPRLILRAHDLNIGTRVTLETVVYERAHAGSNKCERHCKEVVREIGALLRANSFWSIENEPAFTCLWVISITQTEANSW